MRDAAKGVLGAGPVLHRKDTDAVARSHLGDRVAHMQPDPLLADHDRADVGLRRGFDDRVDRIADQKLDALAFQDFGDGVGDLHGDSPPCWAMLAPIVTRTEPFMLRKPAWSDRSRPKWRVWFYAQSQPKIGSIMSVCAI